MEVTTAPIDLQYVDMFFLLMHFFSPQHEADSRTASVWKALKCNEIEQLKGELVGLGDFFVSLVLVLLFVWVFFCFVSFCFSFLFCLV